jgi:hypothetical protein
MIPALSPAILFFLIGLLLYATNRSWGVYIPDATGLLSMSLGGICIIVALYRHFRKKSGAGPSDQPPINDIKKTPE